MWLVCQSLMTQLEFQILETASGTDQQSSPLTWRVAEGVGASGKDSDHGLNWQPVAGVCCCQLASGKELLSNESWGLSCSTSQGWVMI
jgi:hypothetical protein